MIHLICFRLSTHISCLPFYTAGTSCSRDSCLTVSVKSHYATSIDTRISQKFCNILVIYLLYSLDYKQKLPSIRSRIHRVAHFDIIFLLVLWAHDNTSSCASRWRSPSTSLDCWGVMSKSSVSGQVINMRELIPSTGCDINSIPLTSCGLLRFIGPVWGLLSYKWKSHFLLTNT